MTPTRQEEKQENREGFEKRQAAKSGQSGFGRGTIGPDKSRDSSKYPQTMTERHGITKGQKRQTEEDDDRRVVREEGQVYDGAEDLENLSGERQKNVMHHREQGNDEALVGHTNNAEHATQAAQGPQSLLSTPEVLFASKPDRPYRLSGATKIAYDVVRSTSAAGPSMITPFRPLNERITTPFEGRTTRPRGETASLDRLAQAKADKEDYDIVVSTCPQGETTSQAGMSQNKHCANCGGNGHLLVNCITAEHGSIKVCVFCRTKDHLTDECRSFNKLGLAAKVKLLVKDRAGKPELATRRRWWHYLHDFLVSEETKGVPIPTAFPWSPKFAEDLFKCRFPKNIDQIQEEFDR
ncbi:hypothetical protein F25303_10326 [Fusarium sp. NRRL 25303]|nr:hypothetical protein F25303_10326 [Fusarium sp. NRRL 25303]